MQLGGRVLKARAVVLSEDVAIEELRSPSADDGGREPDGPLSPVSDPRADALLADAFREAETLLRQARDEAEALRVAAREDGYRDGRADGYREGLEAARREAQALVDAAREEGRELRRESARSLGQLACELASHVLGVALSLNPALVEDAARTLLEEARPLGVVSLAVAPADLESARRARARWQADLGGEVEIALVPDPTLPAGAVRVETGAGTLERIWPERLAEMDRAMEEVASNLGSDGEDGS